MIPNGIIVPLLSPGDHGAQLDEIVRIVNANVPAFQMPHIIEPRYEHVYVTSDIHADLRKLHFLFKRAELINDDNDDITVPDIMASLDTINWIKPNTLLIIIGDLIDGKRGYNEVDDTLGNIELLLHIYLHNLRIKARAVNSEIRFTIGNHDYHTVIYNNIGKNQLPEFYDLYVHKSSKNYFGTPARRAYYLLPFYRCSPFLMLSVGTELAFIHGGFHPEENPASPFFDIMLEIQNYIDANGLDKITDVYHDVLSCVSATSPTCTQPSSFGKVTSPLWTRWYAKNPSGSVCSQVITSPYQMIVVGHCPTENWPENNHFHEIFTKPDYQQPNNCSTGGCVLTSCFDARGPHLAFVDIGMCSSLKSFYVNWGYEKTRTAEILHFSHVEGGADRFYNKITRDGLAPFKDITPVWTAPQSGGYKNKQTRHSKSKRKHAKKLTRSRYSHK